MGEAVRQIGHGCPVCGLRDGEAYLRCPLAGCPNVRDRREGASLAAHDVVRAPEPEILPPLNYRTRPVSATREILKLGAGLALFVALLVAALWWRGAAQPMVSIHYAPAENLEPYDVALIDRARRTIDMAAYVLSDKPVVEALERAARRGVVIRILADRGQLEDRPESAPLIALQDLPGVTLRVKRGYVYMHLKSYALDGRWLRSGAGNFSASGLKQQDNDMVLVDSPALAAGFERNFEKIFAEGDVQ